MLILALLTDIVRQRLRPLTSPLSEMRHRMREAWLQRLVEARPIAGGQRANALYEAQAARQVLLGFKVDRATATLPQTTAHALFTIAGGRVLITGIVGEVTTVIQTQANDAKLTANPTTGTSVDMCAALDITADEAGCLYGITGTPANAMVGTNAGLTPAMAVGQILNIGTIDLDCAASNTGSVKWSVTYIPVDDGATIVAA